MDGGNPRIARAKQIIGEAIRKRREEAGISQNALAALAKKSGIPGGNRSYLIAIENGEGNPTVETIAGLLSLCRVDFEEFLTGLKSSDRPPEHEDLHRMLSIILNSGVTELVQGIRINLETIAEKAIRLQKARASPNPGSGTGDGAQQGVAKLSKESNLRRGQAKKKAG